MINKKSSNLPIAVILLTTLLAGTLDIIAAFLHSYIRSGTSPVIILQFIASGVLGDSAFSGGLPVAILGLIFHFFIAFTWTILFFLIYPKINFHSKYKIIVGLGYGIIVWLIMNLIVLPLSNTPEIPFRFSQFLLGISFIMFLVGLPVSLIFHKYRENME